MTTLNLEVLVADHASKALEHIGKKMEALGHSSEKAGKASKGGGLGSLLGGVGKAGAIGAAVGGLAVLAVKAGEWVEKAKEGQKSEALFALAMKNSTHATKEQTEAAEKQITVMAQQTGTSREELRPAFQRLVGATHDTSKAFRLLTEAQNISAATGKPLGVVSQALTKAYNGNVGALSRLGIKTTDMAKSGAKIAATSALQEQAQIRYNAAVKKYGVNSTQARLAEQRLISTTAAHKEALTHLSKTTITMAEAQKRIDKQFGGASKTAANTLAGKQKILGERWSEIEESIGKALIPVLTKLAGYIIDDVIPAIGATVAWISKVVDKIKLWWSHSKTLQKILAGAFKAIKLNVKELWQGFQVAEGIISGVFNALAAVIEPVAKVISQMVKDIGKVTGAAGHIGGGILSHLPRFANGGMVPGAAGAPTLAVVHGGERVLTAAQQRGGSGDTYVIHQHFGPGTNPKEAGRAVNAVLLAYKAGGGKLVTA